MQIKIAFDNNSTKTFTYYAGDSFAEWCKTFFSGRYFGLNAHHTKGNMCIDTYKVKYVECIK
ncbi:hypothetical protein COM73_19975 [Bacillus thuringiensis]|nr:hypothetical protein COM73_19975 [Bacillus thuringiensis]